MKFLPLLTFVCCLYNVLAEDCALTDHDKNVICNEAMNTNGFCTAHGPADEGCKTMASKVEGTDPQCVADHICSFSKGGQKAFIATKDMQGVTVYKDCRKGVSIVSGPGTAGGSPNKGGGSSPNNGTGGPTTNGTSGSPHNGTGGSHHKDPASSPNNGSDGSPSPAPSPKSGGPSNNSNGTNNNPAQQPKSGPPPSNQTGGSDGNGPSTSPAPNGPTPAAPNGPTPAAPNGPTPSAPNGPAPGQPAKPDNGSDTDPPSTTCAS